VHPSLSIPQPEQDRRAAFWQGVRDTLVVAPSFLPFALVCGIASVQAGLTIPAAVALPGLVFGGSSQAVLTQLLQSSSALWIAVLSGLVVNLRMMVYSAAMAQHVRHLPAPRRMLAAFFLVDNAFAMVQQRLQDKPRDAHVLHYYAGIVAVIWPAWLVFCAVGVFAGNIVPASWQLDFAIPLAFIAALSTTVRSLPLAAAAVAGAVASVLLFAMPLKLGLIAACLIGLLAGLTTERLIAWAGGRA
jgi:predicted branched-subunit amino acid permease